MPEISIIVPVYKVEKYLRKCIESILNQTFSNFELILVDDGSPDLCGEICEEYAKKDSRIQVIHKANGGLSDARNVGIDNAIGNYIGFIDSDDYIEKDMFETLYNDIKDNNSDIACCGYYICYKNIKISNNNLDKNLILSREEAIGYIPQISPGAWNKLYKREIFDNIRYPLNKLNEDVFILMDIIEKANKIVFNPKPKYFYIQRQNSITKKKFDTRKWDCIKAWENNLNFVKSKYPKHIKVIEYKYIGAYLYLLDQLIIMDRNTVIDEYIKVKKYITKNILKILTNPYIITKRKIALIIFLICPKLYKRIVIDLTRNRGLIE